MEKKRKTIQFKWRKSLFKGRITLPKRNLRQPDLENHGPLKYFRQFFTDELLEMIVIESNRYSVQKKGISPLLTANDIRDFLAIEISMGLIKLRSWKSYWVARTRIPRVADVMPRNKYAKICSSLHFVNNDEADPEDKYFKVRPVLEYVRQKFLSLEGLDTKFSVDEMMVAYKGRKAGSRRQFMPKKPIKWGFKIFARCGVSGFVHDFFLYAGDGSFNHIEFSEIEREENFSSKCVLALCKTIHDKPLSAVFFDNYFSSPRLMYMLRQEYGILSLGTVRSNRVEGANSFLKSDRVLSREGRGSFDEVVDNNKKVALVKWADTKVVTLGSSYIGSTPVSTISRWSSGAKGRVQVTCPQIVKEYNSFMGGVDKADMLVALYKTPLRTFKWYMALFVHLIDMCLINSWILYTQDHRSESKSLSEFKLDVSDGLSPSPSSKT